MNFSAKPRCLRFPVSSTRLDDLKGHFREFASRLLGYGVIPEADKQLFGQQAYAITDPAKRREAKIAQFKKEKELKNTISVRPRALHELNFRSDFD